MNADNRHASTRREKEEKGGWRGTVSTHHHKRLMPWPSRDLQYTCLLHNYNHTQKQNSTNTTPNYYISIVKTATYSQIKMTHLWIEREREARCEASSTPGGREREGGGELLPPGTHSSMKRRTRYFILTICTSLVFLEGLIARFDCTSEVYGMYLCIFGSFMKKYKWNRS